MMSMLWLLPPVILLAGMVATLLLFRSIERARLDLRDDLVRIGEVRAAVALVRVESGRTRAAFQRLPRQ